jgi:sugar phosphate isomerase/epimerase
MQLSLCNEVIRDWPFEQQCQVAAELGYDGLELAPFLFGDQPHRLSADRRVELRRAAGDAGIVITGLHWLLISPKGLSITTADAGVRRRTLEVLKGLIDLCADLGGAVLVHGSPQQREIATNNSLDDAWGWAREVFGELAVHATQAGVVYCIEPLSRHETGFINTIAEAVDMVQQINNPGFRTMIDTSAAALTEDMPVPDLIRHWLPSGHIAHIQVNDSNRRAPGQGEDDFPAIFRAMRDAGYNGVVSVEPFVYRPDGPLTAARAAGYVRGILEALA